MGNIVFFPTNNVGKYDRYKNSFEKAGFIYKRYLIENAMTEQEIKSIDERYWQFAVPVEDGE